MATHKFTRCLYCGKDLTVPNSLTRRQAYCSDDHERGHLAEYKLLGLEAPQLEDSKNETRASTSSQATAPASSASLTSAQGLCSSVRMQERTRLQPDNEDHDNLHHVPGRVREEQPIVSSGTDPDATKPDPISPKQALGRLLSTLGPSSALPSKHLLDQAIAESTNSASRDPRLVIVRPGRAVKAAAKRMGGPIRFALSTLSMSLVAAVFLFTIYSSTRRSSQMSSNSSDRTSQGSPIPAGVPVQDERSPVPFRRELNVPDGGSSGSPTATSGAGLSEQDSRSNPGQLNNSTNIKDESSNSRSRDSAKDPAGNERPEQSNKAWEEYANSILAPEGHSGFILRGSRSQAGYLQAAKQCHSLFLKYGRLSKMPLEDRRFVGGTVSVAGAFGSMKNNGWFKQRLDRDPETLDAALDYIPLNGPVTKEQFDRFAAEYRWKHAGITTASRLLAMKRPDLFVCVHSENRPKLAAAFYVTPNSLTTFEGYWRLLLLIWRCPWFESRRPQDQTAGLWDARAALLDSLYRDL